MEIEKQEEIVQESVFWENITLNKSKTMLLINLK